MIFNLCEVILLNEWSFDTSSHRLQSNYWFSSTNGSTKHCVHSVWQPQCVKYFWGPLNANLLCSGMYVRSTDKRNSILSCLNMSNAYFYFFSQSLTLGDNKTRLELEFLKKDMNIPYAPVLQNISDISSMVSFIQLLQFILYTFYHT